MKKLIAIILTLIMSVAVFAGCAKKESAGTGDNGNKAKEVKVGFIYIGPIGDGGYTYSHDQGRLAMEKQLGIKAVYKENVPEDKAEVKKAIESMIDEGVTVIFGTSFGYMEGMKESASEHKDVKFFHCSGTESNGVNFVNYFGRIEQARYLSGIVAGLKTKSNTIGYVGAFEIPEVIRGINAFTLGVRSVNPKAVVKVTWTHTWYDPTKEKEAAKALLDQGVDIIAQHQDTAGPQQAAQDKGVFSIGYNTDMKNSAPKAYMTAPIWNWGVYYTSQVKAIKEGTWKAENYWGGMKEGVVDLAPLTEVAPAEAKAAVDKVKADIISGKFNVFTGPIKDQSGAVKIPEGKTMTDAEQLSCDWFVEGVEGKIK